MPQEAHDDQKAKSPSKLIQQGVDQSWNQQNQATTNPQEALNKKFTNNPKKV